MNRFHVVLALIWRYFVQRSFAFLNDDPYNRTGWIAALFWAVVTGINLIRTDKISLIASLFVGLGVVSVTLGNMASLFECLQPCWACDHWRRI